MHLPTRLHEKIQYPSQLVMGAAAPNETEATAEVDSDLHTASVIICM